MNSLFFFFVEEYRESSSGHISTQIKNTILSLFLLRFWLCLEFPTGTACILLQKLIAVAEWVFPLVPKPIAHRWYHSVQAAIASYTIYFSSCRTLFDITGCTDGGRTANVSNVER